MVHGHFTFKYHKLKELRNLKSNSSIIQLI
jgi:hypothetical protein